MHLFYAPDILTTGELPPEESLHCAKVLRLKEGERIGVIDGKGTFVEGEITLSHPKRCAVATLSQRKEARQTGRHIHIAVAPTKNMDRMEWFVEKATEIGIGEISLLRCRYSERKEVNAERLNKILVSAMKQSLKATLPTLNPMEEFKSFITRPRTGLLAIAHCYEGMEKLLLKEYYTKEEDITILIGPEGDFNEEEVRMAIEAGFRPVSLGESRLRTETAALVACHTIHIVG